MTSILPDPRRYPRVNPANDLIRQTMGLLTEREAGLALTRAEALKDTLRALFEADDHAAWQEALDQVPSQEVYKALWQAGLDVVAQPVGTIRHAVIFALPVILVAGCKTQAHLPAQLADVQALTQLLQAQGVIADGAECQLSGKLIHPNALATLTFPQLFRFTRNLVDAGRGLPVALEGDPVPAKDDGVFLRFVVGVAMHNGDANPPIRLGGTTGAWGMAAMKLFSEQLKTPNVTLFPIPRAPMLLPEALRQGQLARKEVDLQCFSSNMIRKLREHSVPITAIACAHDNNELRFTISTPKDDKNWLAHVWPLAPLDSVERIAEGFSGLMAECQIEDTRLVEAVQPDQENGIPYFVTVDDAQFSAVRH